MRLPVLVALLAAALCASASPFALSLPCGDPAASRARLVVNSHVLYGQAVEQLLLSLLSIGFADFCSVLIVVGGAPAELPPQRRGNLTYAETVLNGQDMHGLDVLGRHVDHPLVRAQAYLYTTDTVLFHPLFRLFWAKLGGMFEGKEDEILKPPLRRGVQSTLFALGPAVPRAWADFYHKNLSKDDMVITEQHSGEIGRWGTVRHCRERRVESSSGGGYLELDVYNRGFPRRLFYYPDFGMYKWVLWLKFGDFAGIEPHFNTFKKTLPDPYTGLVSAEYNDGEVHPGETRVAGPNERRVAGYEGKKAAMAGKRGGGGKGGGGGKKKTQPASVAA